MTIYRHLAAALALCAATISHAAAQIPDSVAVCPDDADAQLRVSPVLEAAPAPQFTAVSYEPYPFLCPDSNHIALNGADWSALRDKAAATGDGALRIVLLGDSHIQADGATAVTRRLLQNRYGNAGRGLVTPLKLVGSNQPQDYRLTSTTPGWATARLMKRPWASEMLFTGTSATPPAGECDLSVELLPAAGGSEFSHLRLYYGGDAPAIDAVEAIGGGAIPFSIDTVAPQYVGITLDRRVRGCTLRMTTGGDTRIGGMSLQAGDNGVEFTAIGNNGAAFQSYLKLGTGQGVATMHPDLIILAMGGNDAWGNMTDEMFISSVNALVDELQSANPDARILLTTPAEAQKRQGKKGAYAPHLKIKHFRDLLLEYGRRHGIATWDFYSIAGGDGSSHPWNDAKLFSRDRIHLSWDGYTLMGQLLGEAIAESLSNTENNDR